MESQSSASILKDSCTSDRLLVIPTSQRVLLGYLLHFVRRSFATSERRLAVPIASKRSKTQRASSRREKWKESLQNFDVLPNTSKYALTPGLLIGSYNDAVRGVACRSETSVSLRIADLLLWQSSSEVETIHIRTANVE
jgi:hypothetical protein